MTGRSADYAAPHAPARAADIDALPNFTHQQVVRVITGIMMCLLLAAVDQTVVIPAVPAIAADLNGFSHLSWIVSAYLVSSTALTPIYGKLSDIYGRRRLLMLAIVVFVVASALCGLAQNLLQLIAARALQGIGGAGLMAMAQAVIADVVAPRERGRYQGYMAGTWAIACIFGPILGGALTDHLSWRWIFWINLPIGALAYVLSDRALRMLRVRRRETRIDYGGAVLLTAFIIAALLAMSWGGVEYPWLSAPVLGCAVLSVVIVGVLIWQERRAIDPLLPPRLFANGVFTRGVAIAALAAAGLFGGTFLLPLFFQLVRGANASDSGIMIVPFLVFSTVGAFAAGQLARRLGRAKILVVAGLAGSAIGFGLLALMGPTTPMPLAIVAMAMVGIAIGLCMPSCMVIVQNTAERRDLGAATGALLFLRSMGSAFGSTLVGALLASRFAAGLAGAHVTVPLDLGSLRQSPDAIAALDPAIRAAAATAVGQGFEAAFLSCAVLALAALAIALPMRDLPLQSSAEKPSSIGH